MVFGPLAVVFGLAALGCAGAGDASATGSFDTSACQWSADLPDGSYSLTCDGCTVEKATLSCQCRTEAGAEHPTTLALRQCVTDISNENGVLVENAPAGADSSASGAANSSAPGAETSGTCDLRNVDQSCTEYTGTAAELGPAEETCVAKGGTWSADKCPAPSNDGGCCSYEGHHACGYTHDAYFNQMDPCFANDVCNCDVGQ